MLLYLKNNHIYLPDSNAVLASEDAYFLVVALDFDIEQYNTVVIVNGDVIPYSREFIIDRDKLKAAYLDISIIATHKQTGEDIKYTADRYPITKAIVLGRPCSEWYPAIFKSIVDRVDALEHYKTISENADKLHSEEIANIKAETNLIGLAIKEINETGEIV